uniref:uncharacterized protein LOC122608357 isoform X2 n=1 Tax=Erigeron canadensis TaxID=72917 RepID=UPI001CB93FFB|nr:uncharacterized protein LOC122608357 isoform X2 [Erigeron canadensis]
MGAIRLMGTLRPSRTIYTTSSLQTRLNLVKMKCMSNASGFNIIEKNKIVRCDGERKQVVVLTKAATCSEVALKYYDVPTQTEVSKVLVDVATVVVIVRIAVLQRLRMVTRYRSLWRTAVQMYIEKAMIDCRFFTMFAVGGTLLGSVLCFLEGTYLVVESYMQYFKSLSHHSDHGQVMQLLIEALDMFLVGTAMLVFGMGLHVMFVGSSHRSQLPTSNIFGNFYMKE